MPFVAAYRRSPGAETDDGAGDPVGNPISVAKRGMSSAVDRHVLAIERPGGAKVAQHAGSFRHKRPGPQLQSAV